MSHSFPVTNSVPLIHSYYINFLLAPPFFLSPLDCQKSSFQAFCHDRCDSVIHFVCVYVREGSKVMKIMKRKAGEEDRRGGEK